MAQGLSKGCHCAFALPRHLEAECASRGTEGEGRLPHGLESWPLFCLVLSKATGPDNLLGASMCIAQIFRCLFRHSSLCEAMSTLHKIKTGAILETGWFLIIGSSHSSHTFSGNPPPSCSSSGCYLLGLSHTWLLLCFVPVERCVLFHPALPIPASNDTCSLAGLREKGDVCSDHQFPPKFCKIFKWFLS